MPIQRINYGAAPDDGTGDPLRVAFKKSDDNFVDLDNRKAEQSDVATALAGKVDKVTGKGLSTNDYTNDERDKLANIAKQATKNETDANLRDRSTHTGTQAIATVTGLQTALGSKLPSSGGVMTGNLTVPSLNGGQLGGMRNKIINGDFAVNQRGVYGIVTLDAGAYGHDRWKAGSSGCTYTFSTVQNVTTITITAGSIMQVIEGLSLQSGTHVLSWQGTAQGRVGAGTYGTSGAVTGTVIGGTNQTVEFNAGTVSLVQYEPGAVATPFEHRHIGAELALCQRYYEVGESNACFDGAMAFLTVVSTFLVSKRAAPTIVVNDVVGNVGRVSADATNNIPCTSVGRVSSLRLSVNGHVGGLNSILYAYWTASAEL